MKSVQNLYSVHQWVSCGFRMCHPDWDDARNRQQWGTLFSPRGAGGNFLITGTVGFPGDHWPSAEVTDALEAPMRKALKVWDHRFLNDLEFEGPALTMEVLGRGLWTSVSQIQLDHGAVWDSVSVDLGEKINVTVNSKDEITSQIGFRLQSLIVETGKGVDVEVGLRFDGAGCPLGEVQDWISGELALQLQEQSIDQWLDATTEDVIPEKLFPLLKRKFPSLKGVTLKGQGREIITTSP